jgi:hypothetical protein
MGMQVQQPDKQDDVSAAANAGKEETNPNTGKFSIHEYLGLN